MNKTLNLRSWKSICILVPGALILLSAPSQAGEWKVKYKGTGVGGANGSSSRWVPDQTTQFTDTRTAPGIRYIEGTDIHTYANTSGSATAFLTWVETGAEDLPPKKIYVREFANVSAHAWCPAHRSEATLDNGFQDPTQIVANTDINKYFKSEGTHLTVVDNPSGATEVRVPTRHFEASGDNYCPNGAGGGDTTFTYRVEVLKFTLQVKRKGTATFGPQANLAAGGKTSDEHSADLEVVTSPPLAGVPVDVDVTVGGGGGATDAVVTMNSTVTDAAGKMTGTLKSGDVLQTAQLELDSGQDGQTSVEQKWVEGEDPERWVHDEYFKFDTPNKVTFKPRFKEGTQWVPLKGHTLEFKITQVVFSVWNETTKDWEDKSFTDPAVIAEVGSFSPNVGITDSGDGTYTSNLTIKRSERGILKTIHYKAISEDLFKIY